MTRWASSDLERCEQSWIVATRTTIGVVERGDSTLRIFGLPCAPYLLHHSRGIMPSSMELIGVSRKQTLTNS
jgi:hypothetical protein